MLDPDGPLHHPLGNPGLFSGCGRRSGQRRRWGWVSQRGGRWPRGDGRYTLTQADPSRASVAALHQLAQEMEVAGHLLKACAAPPPRGKATERCGRWFVQRRPQQAYCSPQCQSRASTRAYRAGRGKTPPRRRR